MVFKVSTRQVKKSARAVVSVGYCEMEYLLLPFPRVAYVKRDDGCYYDVYEPFGDGVAICTGYSGMPGKRLKHVEDYEAEAIRIWASDGSYTLKEARVRLLLRELLQENGIR